jgi:hypothetical protein
MRFHVDPGEELAAQSCEFELASNLGEGKWEAGWLRAGEYTHI